MNNGSYDDVSDKDLIEAARAGLSKKIPNRLALHELIDRFEQGVRPSLLSRPALEPLRIDEVRSAIHALKDSCHVSGKIFGEFECVTGLRHSEFKRDEQHVDELIRKLESDLQKNNAIKPKRGE